MPSTHYHYLTIEQRESLAALMRSKLSGEPLSKALARLHEPDYGTCIECGADIPYSRLAEDPAALHCRDCAKLPITR
jgi:RNA polymerase-binding transcription factor DksA